MLFLKIPLWPILGQNPGIFFKWNHTWNRQEFKQESPLSWSVVIRKVPCAFHFSEFAPLPKFSVLAFLGILKIRSVSMWLSHGGQWYLLLSDAGERDGRDAHLWGGIKDLLSLPVCIAKTGKLWIRCSLMCTKVTVTRTQKGTISIGRSLEGSFNLG